jgi:hypothetical protein
MLERLGGEATLDAACEAAIQAMDADPDMAGKTRVIGEDRIVLTTLFKVFGCIHIRPIFMRQGAFETKKRRAH